MYECNSYKTWSTSRALLGRQTGKLGAKHLGTSKPSAEKVLVGTGTVDG